jgi:uncharacterized membrane protein required for colicin V production
MNIQLATWINCAIVVVSTVAITLYINYRLGRLIKMLDGMITDRP